MKPIFRIWAVAALLTFASGMAPGQNIRHISRAEGLTSSAVMHLCRDGDGLVWAGTIEGLYVYYGQSFHPVRFDDGGSLEGYLVESILASDDTTMWAQTAYGLIRIVERGRSHRAFPQFDGTYRLREAPDHSVMVLDKAGMLSYYRRDLDRFIDLNLPHQAVNDLVDIAATDSSVWVAGRPGVFRYRWVTGSGGGIESLAASECVDPEPVVDCAFAEDMLYMVRKDGWLYRLPLSGGPAERLVYVKDELDFRGRLSGVAEMNGKVFLSFAMGGVVGWTLPQEGSPRKTDLGIRAGVFHLMKDRERDVIWVATDGQGIFLYWESAYRLSTCFSADFNEALDKPVRSLLLDRNGWLWVGTKGSGLLAVDRSSGRSDPSRQILYTESNSPLSDNSVYSLTESSHGGIWIGNDAGLDFYDFRTRKIRPVKISDDVQYVHGVCESGDSLLWIATVGSGVYLAGITDTPEGPSLEVISRFVVDGGNFSSNFFFSICDAPDGRVWVGNRGRGVFGITRSGMVSIPLVSSREAPTVNDVFCLRYSGDILWTGTGSGLVGLDGEGNEILFDKYNGLPNNNVHSLLNDGEGGLWAATNDGLARITPDHERIETYGHSKGLELTEFADGAACFAGGELFFGGFGGWVEISPNPDFAGFKGYKPSVLFLEMYRNGVRTILPRNHEPFKLKHRDNSFSVSFCVDDNLAAGEYDYSYRLSRDGKGEWNDNGPIRTVSFTGLSWGDYELSIKARNRANGQETESTRIRFTIDAPWYATLFAQILFSLIVAGLVAALVIALQRRSQKRARQQLEQLQQRHKEELYEGKLRFFTNITHEFCTPLTLIYNPCERILAHDGTDDFVRRYTQLIRSNAIKLNSLIQEIIDYRRIETGNQLYRLVPMDVSALTQDLLASFQESAADKGITVWNGITPDIIWNLDARCYGRIFTNLMSNALKYTPEGGFIRITLAVENEYLILKVYNTGKGIEEKDRKTIFNSFRILDNIEKDALNGLASRNGLGLAICNSMAELLKGTILVDSEVGKWAEFTVSLPLLPESGDDSPQPEQTGFSADVPVPDPVGNGSLPEPAVVAAWSKPSGNRPVILVVDDNTEILAMMKEALSDAFRVVTAESVPEAIGIIKSKSPELIITDIVMPGTDGISLIRQIKQDKHTMNIPLVILSALNSVSDQIRGLLSGGDAYVGKPFDFNHLRAVIVRLLERSETMREYYRTSASAYGYAEGKLMTAEDKEFVREATSWVESNVWQEIGVEQLAEHMNMSLRSMYRKFKSLEMMPPKDFIKDIKLERSAQLLRTTSKTIQEVLYECGFNNRAHFYKEFEKKFGMTPKSFRLHHHGDV